MTDTVIAAGKDASLRLATPDRARPEPKRPVLTTAAASVAVLLPYKDQVDGRSVSTAVLSCPVRDGWLAQTVTVALIAEEWSPATATWASPPSTGATESDLQPALADGSRFEVDVTTLVNAVAAGDDDYGFLVTTDSAAANLLYGFASGQESWQLEIEYADDAEAPTILAPLGGTTDLEPTITWEAGDFGDESTTQTSSRVQVNAGAPDDVSPDYDSGVESNIYSEWDLSADPAFTGVDGTTYYARVELNGNGLWSDWVSWTAESWAAGSIDNPGATAWDPTLTLAASVTGGVIRKNRWQIFSDATGVKRYDSGWLSGAGATDVTHTVPEKWRGKRVHVDDREYRVDWLFTDRNDRTPNGDDPGWRKVSQVYEFDDDATPTPPSDLQVAQLGDSCWTEWAFERESGISTKWVFGIGDRTIAVVEPDDDQLENVGTSWTWRTPVVPAYVTNVCWVRAVDSVTEKRTTKAEAAFYYELAGVWLADETRYARKVMLDGINVDGLRKADRRAIYSPIGAEYDIDIVYALRGLSGPITGGISSTRGRDWEADLGYLRNMREATDVAVRLAYGTVNVPVVLRNVTDGLPSPDMLPHNMKHTVVLDVEQVDEFGDD